MPITWHTLHHSALSTRDLYALLELRSRVFVVEQNCAYQDVDGQDLSADTHHLLARQDGQLLAYLRLLDPSTQGGEVVIGRVLTAPAARGSGLRDIMAEQTDGQQRLDSIVRQIAGVMVADVCSIYLRRQDGSLELFASEGLNPTAVHATMLKKGEGLVGRCAELGVPINESDAPKHPAFSYRPETGEEVYHSLLAVPIQRSGQVLGVLVVQNRTVKEYSDEDVEVMQARLYRGLEDRLQVVDRLREALALGDHALRLDQLRHLLRPLGDVPARADPVIAGIGDHLDALLERPFLAVRVPALHCP